MIRCRGGKSRKEGGEGGKGADAYLLTYAYINCSNPLYLVSTMAGYNRDDKHTDRQISIPMHLFRGHKEP